MPMLRAVIFDFNGIILDDEPLHYRAMKEAVSSLGIDLAEAEYLEEFLPFDDWSCLSAICEKHGRNLTEAERERALFLKSSGYARLLKGSYPVFPGAAELVAEAAARYPLAIATGARREEVCQTLETTGLARYFTVVVAAQDFTLGKPHPESFLLALERLNARLDGRLPAIRPAECLVIEDSVAGIEGARKAGMSCLAVANTYPREKLTGANRVVDSLREVDVRSLEALFGEDP
ncbi:MAG: HAD family phosphatase [Acidobacteria bacterium]|nr:HAD family phosphatase [Acidobacteriota bacterium]